MEYCPTITLKPGDVISIPDFGTKTIGAIHEVRRGRYQIRLDEKFTESVAVDVITAITLKPFDAINIPGLGTKIIGAIHQIRRGRYQIRLDEKFVESVRLDVVIPDSEERAPEQHDGSWKPRPGKTTIRQTRDQLYAALGTTDEEFIAGLEGKPIRFTPGGNPELPPGLSHI